MKIYSLFYTIPAFLAVPAAFADISLGQPAGARNMAAAQGAYHSDLLASNVVHAVLKEIREVPVVSLETATPETAQIAVFEVKQNLAHRRYDRMGDAALQAGKLFPVSLAADVPGQDAALADKIRAMKPGDEAVMKMDHIYVFREDGNENVRACTRFEQTEQQTPASGGEAATPATPSVSAPTPAPAAVSNPAALNTPTDPFNSNGFRTIIQMGGNAAGADSYGSSVSTSIVMKPDAQGIMRRTKVEVRREYSGGKETVRKFINDVEVDPQTDQPLLTAPAEPEGDATPQAAPPAPQAEPAKPEANSALPPIPEPPATPDKEG